MVLPEGEVEDDVFILQQVDTRHHRKSLLLSSSAVHHTTASDASDSGLGKTLVISGGSGYNDLVGATPGATFVMPVSDNGGSSSEIIRVLGGPSLGDLRSRLVRLIPLSTDRDRYPPAPPSNDALHALLSHRLPSKGSSKVIMEEWQDILQGRHRLWRGIESERKECVRGFLVEFQSEILRRAHRNFNFRGGSIGNFFLAAAQKFFRSIQSAIFLFSATALINTTQAGRVLPVINTNHTATIAVTLQDGQTILGQCEISHPARPRPLTGMTPRSQSDSEAGSAIFDQPQTTSLLSKVTVGSSGDGLEPEAGFNEDDDSVQADGDGDSDDDEGDEFDDDPTLPKQSRRRTGNIVFNKDAREGGPEDRLPSPIERLFYVNAYGNEVRPAPNPEYVDSIHSSKTLLYSCGSLWTSIVPSLALRGVATAITTSSSLKYKILLLNTLSDRETHDLTGLDFVRVIARAISHHTEIEIETYNSVITHIIYSPEGNISLDVEAMEKLGIQCIAVHLQPGKVYYEEEQLKQALRKIVER
ncbi:hypothetical protein CBS101457_004378 [Exobasidium rhododendri]|nr:hypothetical protein CBS101457_004378 [Exobasidium rhododendri]